MLKKLAIILIFAFTLTTLFGCGKKPTEEPTDPEIETTVEQTTVEETIEDELDEGTFVETREVEVKDAEGNPVLDESGVATKKFVAVFIVSGTHEEKELEIIDGVLLVEGDTYMLNLTNGTYAKIETENPTETEVEVEPDSDVEPNSEVESSTEVESSVIDDPTDTESGTEVVTTVAE